MLPEWLWDAASGGADARPPQQVRGGIEFGFSSTTTKRDVACFYAKSAEEGMASTILEAENVTELEKWMSAIQVGMHAHELHLHL